MSIRLINRLLKERTAGRKLFVPFITAGDRGLDFTRQAVLALDQAGADAVELGVPFSDPLADGKVIQASSQRALEQHTTLAGIIDMVHTLRSKTDMPILLMGYLNPFLQKNANAMAKWLVQAGVDGTIIPDYPPEEAMDWIKACGEQDLDTVFLTTPNSTPDRLAAVAQASTGYIYYVSVTGTTGARTQLPAHLQQGIARVRSMTFLPILVGFGIATPEQAARVAKVSDGVIVGSALVKTLAGKENNRAALKKFIQLAANIAKAVKK
ncbi:tryptophan synthase subunit alpha [bacterium]|nr:tryptophan synthase subunit alpha [bacterium]